MVSAIRPVRADETLTCRESQEWTYGVDNTGTRFNDVATYEMTLSDGTTLTWSQDGSSASWAAQLTEWAANIQIEADNAGLVWFVEPRFIDFYNVTNLDGTINGPGGTPSGLPGAPSEIVAVALDAGGMRWRYVNFQICPGQPVPVSARRMTSQTYGDGEYELTAAGPVLGPVQEFRVCEDCTKDGIEQEWFIRDDGAKPAGYEGVFFRPASAGEIPNCYFPCGFLSLQPDPPSRDCEFEFANGCDNNNQDLLPVFTQLVTRRATICNGQRIAVDYFIPDPSDPAALIEYTLVGAFVDCATGEPIPEPEPQYFEIKEERLCETDARFLLLIDSGGNFARYSFYTKEWETVSTLSVSSAGGSADYDSFRLYNFVAPDQMTTIDVNTDTQLPNITLTDGIIKPGLTSNPKSFSAASFRQSNGRLYAQDTGGADAGLYSVDVATGVVDFVTAITGVAGSGTSIMIDNSTDTLIVNGSNFSYSVDWVTGVGTLWGNPPVQPNGGTFDDQGNAYVTQGLNTYCLPAGADPNDTAAWTQIIDDWGPGANSIAFYRTEAAEPSCFIRRFGIYDDGSSDIIGDFNVSDNSPRTIVGEVNCCECGCGDDSGGGGSAFDGNTTDVTPNPDQTHVIVHGTGSVPAGLKSVTINNITGVTTIDGAFEIGTGRRVDAISYNATEIGRARGLLPAIALSGGTWQWTGMQPIAEV